MNGQGLHDGYEERLRDNTQTPVPDQVAFRLNFPAWFLTLSDQEQRLVADMAMNRPHDGRTDSPAPSAVRGT